MGRRRPLHLFLAFSSIPVKNLNKVASQSAGEAYLEELSPNFYKFNLILRRRSASGWLAISDDIWSFYVEPHERPTWFGQIVTNWLDGLFPAISTCRLKPSDLLDLLDNLAGLNASYVRIHDYLLKSYPGGTTSKNWVLERPYDRQILEGEARSIRKLIDAIHFTFSADQQTFEAKISRGGHIVLYHGGRSGFSAFHRLLLVPIIELSVAHRQKMNKKERRIIRGEPAVFPIDYSFSKPLSVTEDFERITNALLDKTSYTISVIHKGNPWLSIHPQTVNNFAKVREFRD